MQSNLWVEEKYKDFLGVRFKVEQVLFSGKSEFQSVDIVETRGHGRMLLNDGLVMVTERDEFVYHDMISHVPLFVHPDPQRVLIIGGGDGGTAREVLRHNSVKHVTMVEIDRMVTDACREYIPQTSKCLDDPRLDLRFEDGVKYVKEFGNSTQDKYDVILVDSTDPIGPAAPLFNEDFYRDIYKSLSENGVVVSQGENSFYELEMQKKLLQIKNTIFEKVSIYNFSNLTYPGGLWSFTFGSKGLHPVKDFDPMKVKESGLEFEYYNEKVHEAAFSIPNFALKELKPYFKD